MYGYGTLSTSNYFTTAGGAGIVGNASGFYVAYLCKLTNIANSQYWSSCSAGSNSGWELRQNAASTLAFIAYDGSGVAKTSPAFTLTGLTGQVLAVMGVHDGSALKLYANRAQVGTSTALTGYTAAGAAAQSIARFAASGCDLYGMVGGLGVPSLANFQSWCDAVKSARGIVDMVGVGGQHMWRAASTVANMSDMIGSATFTKTGTPTVAPNYTPQWAW